MHNAHKLACKGTTFFLYMQAHMRFIAKNVYFYLKKHATFVL